MDFISKFDSADLVTFTEEMLNEKLEMRVYVVTCFVFW